MKYSRSNRKRSVFFSFNFFSCNSIQNMKYTEGFSTKSVTLNSFSIHFIRRKAKLKKPNYLGYVLLVKWKVFLIIFDRLSISYGGTLEVQWPAFHTHTHTLSLSLSLTHTNTRARKTYFLFLFHKHTLTHTLSHTYILSHSLAHTHTQNILSFSLTHT